MAESSWVVALPPSLLLAATILGEARSEPVEGQIAVASVIRTRSLNRGLSYPAVILAPWQFSCWNDADPNRIYMLDLLSKHPTHDGVWQQAQWVAEGIILGKILDNVHGSEHYMTRAVYDVGRPKWANSMSIVAEIGHHVFLK